MARYTLRGSAELDARIDADLARVAQAVAASRFAGLYRALILLGGYGRGEGTPFLREGREEPFNDYDLVVVARALSRGARREVQADLRRLERELGEALGLPVDLCLYPDQVLRTAEFSLLNYEMKFGHRVVWGAADLAHEMPDYPHDRIPLSEGTRLLLNRGKLLLDIRRALRDTPDGDAARRLVHIKFLMKALLAFGDATLLAHRDYDLRYAVKRERILNYAESDVPDAAFMIEGYRRAIALKEWGDYAPLAGFDVAAEFETIRRYYLAFLRWYEGRRLGAPVGAAPSDYAAALARGGREGPAARSAVLNLVAFGPRALNLGLPGLAAHPRARLYAALPVLLGDDATGPDAAAARWLGAADARRKSLEDAFYRLHRRWS